MDLSFTLFKVTALKVSYIFSPKLCNVFNPAVISIPIYTMNYSMNAKVEAFYRTIFADLTVDREEAAELVEFFTEANPPPDKNVWLRATAFRIGCEFLTDDKDTNTALLRAINAIVHAVETSRMA